MRIIEFLKKYRLGMLFILSLAVFLIFYSKTFYPNYEAKTKEVQSNFLKLEDKMHKRLIEEKKEYNKRGNAKRWEHERGTEIAIHIFKQDSLVYWNTNQLPILRFEDIHFPSQGMVHLQNGWYYSEFVELDDTKICATFLIRQDYPYENADLENRFSPRLVKSLYANIALEEGEFNIKNKEKEFQFSIVPEENFQISQTESLILFLLFIGIIGFALIVFFFWWKGLSKRKQVILIPIFIMFRACWQYFNWSRFLYEIEGFDPQLYASNEFLLPNFGAFLINIASTVLVLHMCRILIEKWRPSPMKKSVLQIVVLSFFFFWSLFLYLNHGMIENSIIPFDINRLFNLNAYSFLGISALGVFFHAGAMLLNKSAQSLWTEDIKMNRLMVIIFIIGTLYFFHQINYGEQMLFAGIFPTLLLYAIFFITKEVKSKFVFTQVLSLFFLFSFCFATNIWVYNERDERKKRELFANVLRTDQDITTEAEFNRSAPLIREEPLINRFASKEQKIGRNEFQDRLERKVFNGYWEQYDMEFHLYAEDGTSLVMEELLDKEKLDTLIEMHGQQSSIDSSAYFIEDYIEQFSYMLRMPILNKDGEKIFFYGTFKSKRIPEEIGFPRLLISNQAKVFKSLENYSVAKYHDGRLVNRYGEFNFPTYVSVLNESPKNVQGYMDYRGFNHYMTKSSGNNSVVLSAPNLGWFDLLTTFSYLFCFLGFLVLPFLFKVNEYQMGRGTLTLAVKIQLVLVAFVFMSLLIYGWGSGIFVRDQYNNYTNKVISEKLHSVEIEFQTKFGEEKELNIEKDGGKMSFYLKKFSKVFVTDINFYDIHGYIMSSSRPKVYNIGLLSEQMNPLALKEMKLNFDSEFTHQETIGKLNYSSAYLPFFGSSGELVGYLNLQHFGQQKEFESQIQNFLTAIINVFMLLLAASIVIAIFVSGWLTAPLRLLQESFAKVDLGQRNEQIEYDKDDEIGALVKEYNQKIDELAIKAQQLAQSERESAWREMAKQVAHEIKNPLTPMKLGLQHFERMYTPEDPMPKEKLQKVVQSLVEQIDGLTRIANEFSNFAKMPNPDVQEVELLTLIDGVVELFDQDDSNKVVLHKGQEKIHVVADKDMLVRIFNNLIKNALQAVQEKTDGLVEIYTHEGENTIEIEVRDNGKGISLDEQQNIFIPYFTTKSAGTGLGLAMVKQMVELHHGTIHFESKEGKGTSFFVDFPKAFRQK